MAAVYFSVPLESTAHCPDAEDLSSFIEGRLAQEGSMRIVQHLDGCDECLDVFAETLRYHLRVVTRSVTPRYLL